MIRKCECGVECEGVCRLTSMVAKQCGTTEGEIILSAFFDTLRDDERRAVRETLLKSGTQRLPKTLYFNYETQTIVD